MIRNMDLAGALIVIVLAIWGIAWLADKWNRSEKMEELDNDR